MAAVTVLDNDKLIADATDAFQKAGYRVKGPVCVIGTDECPSRTFCWYKYGNRVQLIYVPIGHKTLYLVWNADVRLKSLLDTVHISMEPAEFGWATLSALVDCDTIVAVRAGAGTTVTPAPGRNAVLVISSHEDADMDHFLPSHASHSCMARALMTAVGENGHLAGVLLEEQYALLDKFQTVCDEMIIAPPPCLAEGGSSRKRPRTE